MKIEHQYQWMTLWCGRMTKTRHWATEESIKKNHPEAVRVEGSLRIVEIPETDEEWRVRLMAVDTANIGKSATPR